MIEYIALNNGMTLTIKARDGALYTVIYTYGWIVVCFISVIVHNQSKWYLFHILRDCFIGTMAIVWWSPGPNATDGFLNYVFKISQQLTILNATKNNTEITDHSTTIQRSTIQLHIHEMNYILHLEIYCILIKIAMYVETLHTIRYRSQTFSGYNCQITIRISFIFSKIDGPHQQIFVAFHRYLDLEYSRTKNGICYISAKRVRFPRNEKQAYQMNSRPQMWSLGFTLTMTFNLNFQGPIFHLLYLMTKIIRLPQKEKGTYRRILGFKCSH